jgi:hypothetical protein
MYTYEGYDLKDIVRLLGEDDAKWFASGLPIPYQADKSVWDKKEKIQSLIKKSKLKIQPRPEFKAPKINIVSDALGEGVKGVFNPADGKTYDSKSEYYKAVATKGLVINDSPKIAPSKPKLKEIDWEKSVADTIKTLSPTKKGKKK